jgi:site-specific recombinase XerD
MGHADLDTTQRYVHLSKGHLEDAQKKTERFRARQRFL